MSLHLFRFKEVIPTNYRSALPPYFRIGPNTTYDVLLLRMLTSNIGIYNNKTRSSITLAYNFASFPSHEVSRKSALPIRTVLFPFALEDYVKFSQKFYGRNIIFYHNLLQELTFYFNYSSEGQFQAAFVNLYRMLEYVSYSFPLIHASHFGNYTGSFEALRGYFTDVKTSEIKFFEKFLDNLFRGTGYLTYTTDFDFSHVDSVIANNCYDAFYNLLNANDWVQANRPTQFLSVENKKLIALFKNTRNRYFHFATGGQRNLSNTDLKDPDFFFERINDGFLNWLAFIFANVIRESLDNTLL